MMNTKTLTKIAGVVAIAAALGAISGIALGGEHEGEEHEGSSLLKRLFGSGEEHEGGEREGRSGNGASAAASRADKRHTLYATECGACHFAYPANLLPAASWQQITTRLDQHFGENAELDPADQRTLTDYLVAHAGQRGWMARLAGSDQKPTRITKTSWFVNKHDEVSNQAVRNNPKVRSFSNCDACHTRAAQGSFSEDDVRIPHG